MYRSEKPTKFDSVKLIIISALCAGLLMAANSITAKDLATSSQSEIATLSKTLSLAPDELFFVLPDDADRKNYKRQLKAIQIGFYWSTSNTLKPLDIQFAQSE